MDCKHGAIDDFSRQVATTGKPIRLWTCDGCGKEAQWGKGWSYWGQLACKGCGSESPVEGVACSMKCRKAAKAKRSTPPTDQQETE